MIKVSLKFVSFYLTILGIFYMASCIGMIFGYLFNYESLKSLTISVIPTLAMFGILLFLDFPQSIPKSKGIEKTEIQSK